MKKIFNVSYFLVLTAVFSAGGFYLGAKDQKVEVVLPAVARVVTQTATTTKTVMIEEPKPVAVKPKAAVVVPKPVVEPKVVSVPVVTPEPIPEPDPEPTTKVS